MENGFSSSISINNINNPIVGKLSTEEVMRLAAKRFIECSTQANDDSLSVYMHHYSTDILYLSIEDLKDVELAQLLLSTAEKISLRQYQTSRKLLTRCELMASCTGNPVERVVYYFAEALREKIENQIGKKSAAGENADRNINAYDDSIASGSGLEFIKLHQAIPFIQACQFAGMQAILENLISSKKIHLIDLQLRNGSHWTILMQALASSRENYPIKLLKLTAVGTTNKKAIKETCQRLAVFAKSLELQLCYKVVFVPDLIDLNINQLEVEPDEMIAIYSQSALMLTLSKPGHLDNLMAVISRIKPAIMVIIELEAKHNSPFFVNRFTEALFFHSAYFDCFEAFMKRDDKHRMMMEGMYFREGIRNIVACDGNERVKRCVTIDVWRKFFARYRMVENKISDLSISYASRIIVNLSNYQCSNCSIDKNGECLIVGWKGTPLHSLSIWRFLEG